MEISLTFYWDNSNYMVEYNNTSRFKGIRDKNGNRPNKVVIEADTISQSIEYLNTHASTLYDVLHGIRKEIVCRTR